MYTHLKRVNLGELIYIRLSSIIGILLLAYYPELPSDEEYSKARILVRIFMQHAVIP